MKNKIRKWTLFLLLSIFILPSFSSNRSVDFDHFLSCIRNESDLNSSDIARKTYLNEPDSIIKVLAIGNSFSEDALEEHLFEIFKEVGLSVIIGNLYIGGADLDLHLNNLQGDESKYQYRKIDTSGNHENFSNKSILFAMEDENWDFISLQQVSSKAGKYRTYFPQIIKIKNGVEAHSTDAEIILHQVWSYAEDSDHKGFKNYRNDQRIMYDSIVHTVNRVAEKIDVAKIVPSGTAIQNGRSSFFGDHFNRDGYHLDRTIGRYVVAAVWFEALTGKSVLGNAYTPKGLTDCETRILQMAAHRAYKKPNEMSVISDRCGND